jgi:hypothetical protein
MKQGSTIHFTKKEHIAKTLFGWQALWLRADFQKIEADSK